MSSIVPVALIIPMLNEADTLHELLASIDRQTVNPRELVFCDAGSTDASRKIVQSWWSQAKWPNCTCEIINSKGAMPGKGRNVGIKNSSSPFVAFLDCGIRAADDWLENLYNLISGRKLAAVLGVCEFRAKEPFEIAVCAMSSGVDRKHPALPASIFCRDAIYEIGMFDENLRAGEDLLFLRKLEKHYGKLEICPDATVVYEHFPTSFVSLFNKWRLAETICTIQNLRKSQRLMYLASVLVFVFCFLLNVYAVLCFVVLYVFARSFIDPMRRSISGRWWATNTKSLIYAIPVAVTIDAAKVTGISLGYLGMFRGYFSNNKEYVRSG